MSSDDELASAIATEARRLLGRPAFRRTTRVDSAAWAAIAVATERTAHIPIRRQYGERGAWITHPDKRLQRDGLKAMTAHYLNAASKANP